MKKRRKSTIYQRGSPMNFHEKRRKSAIYQRGTPTNFHEKTSKISLYEFKLKFLKKISNDKDTSPSKHMKSVRRGYP